MDRALKPIDDKVSHTPFSYDAQALDKLRPDQVPRFLGAVTDPKGCERRTVQLNSLHSIQNRVDTGKTEAMRQQLANGEDLGDKPPVVVRYAGKNLIADGHHRLAAHYLNGDDTAEVAYKDLTAHDNALKLGKAGHIIDDGWLEDDLHHLDQQWLEDMRVVDEMTLHAGSDFAKYSPNQARDAIGRWASGFGRGPGTQINYKDVLAFTVPAVVVDCAVAYFGFHVITKVIGAVLAATTGVGIGVAAGVIAVDLAAPGLIAGALGLAARRAAASRGAAGVAARATKAAGGKEIDAVALLLSHMSPKEIEVLNDHLLASLTEDQKRELAIYISAREHQTKMAKGAGEHPFDMGNDLAEIDHRLTRADVEFFLAQLPPTVLAELCAAVRKAFPDACKLVKYDEDEPRDERGRWTHHGALGAASALAADHPAAGTAFGVAAAAGATGSQLLIPTLAAYGMSRVLSGITHLITSEEARHRIVSAASALVMRVRSRFKLAKGMLPWRGISTIWNETPHPRGPHGRFSESGIVRTEARQAKVGADLTHRKWVVAHQHLHRGSKPEDVIRAGSEAGRTGVKKEHIAAFADRQDLTDKQARLLASSYRAHLDEAEKLAKWNVDQARGADGKWTSGDIIAPHPQPPSGSAVGSAHEGDATFWQEPGATSPAQTISRGPRGWVDPMPGPWVADTFGERFGDEPYQSVSSRMQYQRLDPDPSTNLLPYATPASFEAWTGKPVSQFTTLDHVSEPTMSDEAAPMDEDMIDVPVS